MSERANLLRQLDDAWRAVDGKTPESYAISLLLALEKERLSGALSCRIEAMADFSGACTCLERQLFHHTSECRFRMFLRKQDPAVERVRNILTSPNVDPLDEATIERIVRAARDQ